MVDARFGSYARRTDLSIAARNPFARPISTILFSAWPATPTTKAWTPVPLVGLRAARPLNLPCYKPETRITSGHSNEEQHHDHGGDIGRHGNLAENGGDRGGVDCSDIPGGAHGPHRNLPR